MARRKKYAGRRRHPSSHAKCASPMQSASPMKYINKNETDLSDGIQAGAFRDPETDKINVGNMGKAAGAAGLAGLAGGAIGMIAGGPVGLLAGAAVGAKKLKEARNAKIYNEGHEEADIASMEDLSF